MLVKTAPGVFDMRLLHKLSPHDVATTIDRLAQAVEMAGGTVFARVNHADAAGHAGLDLRPTQVLIFGNPKAGTPLMQAAPTVALDLPMKVLAWQDDRGQVHVVWNSPDFLIRRHVMDSVYSKNLSAIGGLVDAALK